MTSMQGASMNDFWLRSWSLSGIENVSVLLKNRFAFNRKALRLFFSSRELFFSSIWTVWTSLRSVRQLSDLGKEKFSLRKETSPSSFSISEQPLSSSTEHIFHSWNGIGHASNFCCVSWRQAHFHSWSGKYIPSGCWSPKVHLKGNIGWIIYVSQAGVS